MADSSWDVWPIPSECPHLPPPRLPVHKGNFGHHWLIVEQVGTRSEGFLPESLLWSLIWKNERGREREGREKGGGRQSRKKMERTERLV